LSAYTTLAIALPLAEGCSSNKNEAALPMLFSHLADKDMIRETGQAYRKLFPKEDDQSVLTKLLIGEQASKNGADIQNMLDKCVLDDFKTDKIVTPAGWILSVTEARQCALYSILNA
jgi:hypothetical protein